MAEREFAMIIAPLDVFRLNSNDVGGCITTVDSLLEALNAVRKRGRGEYIVYSQKTGRRRFYEVAGDGRIVFWEREELAVPRR